MKYDVIIVGGGPSGLMAAIAASEFGARTLLLDKGDKLGRKLGISGGGRCNVTNAKEIDDIIRHIPGNGRFLYSAFSHFNNQDIIRFFEGLGIRLKEEDNGRMFPVTDKAKTVVDALVAQVRKQGVHIQVNQPVRQIVLQHGQASGVQLYNGTVIDGNSVIVATGGRSVPHTGSTGDGYPWAQSAGHSITELFPTEVPLTSLEPWIRSKELQGLSLRGIALSVWNARGKQLVVHGGDMIFTHFGLSGPAALRCSQFVYKALKQSADGQVKVTIDLFPDKTQAQIYDETWKLAADEPRKAVKNVLKGYYPERMIPLLLQLSELKEETTYDNLSKTGWTVLSGLAKQFPVQVNGTLSIEEAFVTGGGVHLKELDPRTMMSKLAEGLFFCGEVLDVHGYTGGYNITAAFATGYTAGKSAAERIH